MLKEMKRGRLLHILAQIIFTKAFGIYAIITKFILRVCHLLLADSLV